MSLPSWDMFVSGRGVATDLEKVIADWDWPKPESISELHTQFLGMASYYHMFSKGFATITIPQH